MSERRRSKHAEAVIDCSLRHRLVVIVACLAAAGGVSRCATSTSTPSPTRRPVQVQINTVAPALGPEEVEQQITFPDRAGHRRPARAGAAALGLEVRAVAGGRDLRGRHRHLLRPAARQRAAGDRRAARGHRAARRWGRCRPGLGEVFHYVVTGAGRRRHRAAHDPRLGHQAARCGP